MKRSGNTVLITGGSKGIGLELAKVFVREGNRVLACARNAQALEDAKKVVPGLETFVCDVSKDTDRQALFEWATTTAPDLNILINNAAILNAMNFADDAIASTTIESELSINIASPIHLIVLFLPQLRRQPLAAIVSVTSILAYVPFTVTPVYSATKAAMHSYTQSLRHQLKDTPVKVFEVMPPPVDTAMADGLEAPKMSPSDVAERAFNGIVADRAEIRLGLTKASYYMSRIAPALAFRFINAKGEKAG